MNIKEVAEAFCKGYKGIGNTLKSTGDKLISYYTVIAQKAYIDIHSPTIILNTTKYSSTSSRHLGYVKRYLNTHNIPYVTTTKKVPYNTYNLINYL